MITRSTARHLRRRRLKEARKAENQFPVECLNNGTDLKNNQATQVYADCEKTTLTKSKARRLQKMEKAKLLETCNYDTSSTSSDPSQLEFTAHSHTAHSLFPNDSNYKTSQKIEESTESEPKSTKQDKDESQSCPTQIVNIKSGDISTSSRVITSSNMPNCTKKMKEHARITSLTKRNNCKYTHNINHVADEPSTSEQSEPVVATISDQTEGIQITECTDVSLDKSLNNRIPEEKELLHSSPVSQKAPKQFLENENMSENSLTQRQSCTTLEEPVLSIKPDTITSTQIGPPNKVMNVKMANADKTREEIKAEREARKAAKAAAKGKGKSNNILEKESASAKINTPPSSGIKPEANKNTMPHSSDASAIEKNLSNIAESSTIQIKPEGKSKAELRAERRAKQEAQRAVKQEQAAEKTKLQTKTNVKKVQNEKITPDVSIDDSINKSSKKIVKQNAHEVNLFKHLYHERELALNNIPILNSKIHPAIVKLGVQYASKIIVGSNARCVAFLVAVKQLIQDFDQPSKADFIRSLEANLQESVAYLHHCRPLAVSMQNALKHLKWQMTQLASTPMDTDAKNKLKVAIETYILEQIQLADKAISITIQTKISDGNVILTYGYSSLIQKILMDAHDAGKQFRVIIVDGRPWLEGKELLRRLTKHGIKCSYVLINALSFVMPEVSKVFLGAHAILANGAVMSRVGTAQVALMAKAFNVPVLVACETHKSCERVQTDSIVYNELGDADELTWNMYPSTKKSLLHNWKTIKCLNLLNIHYDVTPADLVTAVVTELAILPCTSVPVILRIKPSEI